MFRTIFLVFSLISICIGQSGLHLVTHYCGGQKVREELHFSAEHATCGMRSTDCPEETESSAPHISRGSCCSDRVFRFDTEDGTSHSFPQVVSHPALAVSIQPALFCTLQSFSARPPVMQLSQPPPRGQALYILYHLFLVYS